MSNHQNTGRPRHADQLTPAEWRTVEGVRHGLSNPAIAVRTGISVDAVKFHVGNVLGKLGLASRAELRLWTGIRKDSRLSDLQDPECRPSGVGIAGVGQIARLVGDVEAATRWFVDVVGLTHLYTFGDLAFLDCDGVRLFLSKGDPAGNSILYFRVENIMAAHASLIASGTAIVAAPHLIHRHADGIEEWMCFFNDPDGGTLALMTTTENRG